MTNGADKHHDHAGKKKAGAKKPKPHDAAAAALKRKNLLPGGLDGAKPKPGS
jgi:hypothetical protein